MFAVSHTMFRGWGSSRKGPSPEPLGENGAGDKNTMEPRECTDLATLDPLTEYALVSMVRARYEEARIQPLGGKPQHNMIYTRAGPVVVAVNPLCPVPDIYTPALRRKYHRAGMPSLPARGLSNAPSCAASVAPAVGGACDY